MFPFIECPSFFIIFQPASVSTCSELMLVFMSQEGVYTEQFNIELDKTIKTLKKENIEENLRP